jgi:hypothetical protein
MGFQKGVSMADVISSVLFFGFLLIGAVFFLYLIVALLKQGSTSMRESDFDTDNPNPGAGNDYDGSNEYDY